ncbi:MAG TPA: histidinol dehydrogenase [Deltaproteobacteria bacterium]|nr:histidinol dehydrogenase [Deltaproteobacteria bacterium]
MITISTDAQDWRAELAALLERKDAVREDVDTAVRLILDDVKRRGDEALFEYTRTFDGYDPASSGIAFEADEIGRAYREAPAEMVEALTVAARRIEAFHEQQKERSWFVTEDTGTVLGQKVTPVDSAGIYVPGGLNAFPSTVLMNVIPAKIAGVQAITVVSPTPGGRTSQALLAAAHIAGVERIYRIGGAQAVAALAYGTRSVPRTDKVVGPGNIYVAHAKRLLQGVIGIDSFAGPSEILVVADDGADPRIIALDLLSQAEHDPRASSILLTPSASLAQRVRSSLHEAVESLPRRETALKALDGHGACIVTRDLDEAIAVANEVAPEHLELMLADAWERLGQIRNAGAVFLGYLTPEAIGDYVAGPNHTLPTGSTARFSSPLGVYDFTKRTSVIAFSRQALGEAGPMAVRIARAEDLEAHARSVLCRLDEQDPR